jgi:hypothetical protein
VTFCAVTFCSGDVLLQVTFCAVTFCRGTNYNQARGYMSRMEARLLKTGRLDEFNRQFQDNVDRGV